MPRRKRLTKKRLKALIKDERQAAKMYRKLGLPNIARDEARHRRILLRKARRA